MEVVRDRADNAIIICSIENVDPMGVHTGDSITVAPALTLTDKEYQRMRSASIAVLREIGVETGGSNVQFAVNPKDGRMIVIEMNPRVSRSSALASKATGFPIAKVAARLAVGYTLDEIANDITGGATPASFEPTIDYVVTKIPRFAFEKFKGASDQLSTAMKSVGEVMAIGRSFAESLQKALRGHGNRAVRARPGARADERHAAGNRECAGPADARPAAGRGRGAAPRLHRRADPRRFRGFDPWFLERLAEIVARRGAGPRRGPAARRGGNAAPEGDGLFRQAAGPAGAALGPCRAAKCPRSRRAASGHRPRCAAGPDRRRDRGGSAQGAAEAGRPAGVQADRQLRRRVRCSDALSLFDL